MYGIDQTSQPDKLENTSLEWDYNNIGLIVITTMDDRIQNQIMDIDTHDRNHNLTVKTTFMKSYYFRYDDIYKEKEQQKNTIEPQSREVRRTFEKKRVKSL